LLQNVLDDLNSNALVFVVSRGRDVAFGREVALAPARVLVRPSLLEPPDGRSVSS